MDSALMKDFGKTLSAQLGAEKMGFVSTFLRLSRSLSLNSFEYFVHF
jgi:hypothetical protein